jgi:hypothetical protein
MNTKYSVAVACFLPGRAKDLSAPLYNESLIPSVGMKFGVGNATEDGVCPLTSKIF